MLPQDLTDIADQIEAARVGAAPVAPLAAAIGDAARGYAIQRALIARGGPLAGRKIGLTSKLVQEQLGVFEPVHGPIFAERVLQDGAVLDASELIAPKVEPELAFTLASDVTEALEGDALAATIAHVTPAIEIVDSRVRDWGFKLPDMVADYAVGHSVVIGARSTPIKGLDLAAVHVTAHRNGAVAGEGTGAACLGHPLTALAWLVERMVAEGTPLRAGDIVITGSLTPVLPLAPGDVYRCDYGPLGEVGFRLSTD
ncbi:MAG: fumarylacetoacetate hydrolase family protein [Pseudomonadota bacterium]